MLSSRQQESILSDFPNIKLSYENMIYKKVYNTDAFIAIPEGKKCFAWFTIYDDNNVCFIMELSENKQINSIKIASTCFSSELSYGTILYGTIFNHLSSKFFSIEDIFYYKDKDVSRNTWYDKFCLFKEILKKDLKQVAYNSSFLIFGLPVICNNFADFKNALENIKYKIDSIQFRLLNRCNNSLFMLYKDFIKEKIVDKNIHTNKNQINNNNINNNNFNDKINNSISNEINKQINNEINKQINNNINHQINNKINNKFDQGKIQVKQNNFIKEKEYKSKEIIFKVKPDIQNDIYHLYCNNEKNTLEYHSTAYIPDYKTSVMMNKLFRNIKENINLDALEESDDEEEFENDKIDKFVYLEKEYNMVCLYNYKFKKWYPVKVSNENSNSKIVNKQKLSSYY